MNKTTTKYFLIVEDKNKIVISFKSYDAFMQFQEDFEGWEDKRDFELLAESLEDFIANSEYSIDYDESMCYFSLDSYSYEDDEDGKLIKSYRLENTQYYNIFQYMMTGKYGNYWKDGYDSCLGREMAFVKSNID